MYSPFWNKFLNLKFQWRNERWRISGQKLNDETNDNDFYEQIILTKRDEIFVNESFVRHWRTICVPYCAPDQSILDASAQQLLAKIEVMRLDCNGLE